MVSIFCGLSGADLQGLQDTNVSAPRTGFLGSYSSLGCAEFSQSFCEIQPLGPGKDSGALFTLLGFWFPFCSESIGKADLYRKMVIGWRVRGAY